MKSSMRAFLAATLLPTLCMGAVKSYAQDPGDSRQRVHSVTGLRDNVTFRSVYHMRVAVPEATDPDVATSEALRVVGARPIDPAELEALGFSITGARWLEFFNHGRRDDRVVQYYNPIGVPIADVVEPIMSSAQNTWNTVSSSRFRFEFGGVTTRSAQSGDGFNDVVWEVPLRLNALSMTISNFNVVTGAFLDSDIFLSPRFRWVTAPPPPPPPGCPPPRGVPPPPGCETRPAFDLETTLVHEEGHVLGLDHVFDPAAVMFPDYNGVKRTLADGDMAGITFLYPRQPVRLLARRDPSARYRLIASVGQIIASGTAVWTAFEPGGLNARGDVSFTADLSEERCTDTLCIEGGGQGVFTTQGGWFTQVVRTPQPAPGNPSDVSLGFGVLGASALNEPGDLAFAFLHTKVFPFPRRIPFPPGTDAGVYRYNAHNNVVEPLVIPGMTPATGCSSAPPEYPATPCTFAGGWRADINNRGDVAFTGVVNRPAGEFGGDGIFVGARDGSIRDVVVFGDPATTEGDLFDQVGDPSINDAGDVAFGGHHSGEECLPLAGGCLSSVYVARSATGRIDAIARQGSPAPGGGTFRAAGQPVLNNRGDILFTGDLTPSPGFLRDLGLFLSSSGKMIPVVRPGDEMPGGGRLLTTSIWFTTGPVYSLSNNGQVAFDATLDTDEDEDGIFDTGAYVWQNGVTRLVARSGTIVPGLGQILHIQDARAVGARRSLGGALVNERGEVLFQGVLTDGRVVLLVAEPGK